MLMIQDVLLSDDIIEEKFQCNLNACKGACCWKGDFGAPVTKKEEDTIKEDLHSIFPYLTEASKNRIKHTGGFDNYSEKQFRGTDLHEDGSCVFLVKDDLGYAHCGIEQAYNEGNSSIQKPLSCHLYPIRVSKEEPYVFEAWNYDQWDICSAACDLGKENKVSVYEFCKKAIIRAKGEDFYGELDAAVKHLRNEK